MMQEDEETYLFNLEAILPTIPSCKAKQVIKNILCQAAEYF